MSATAMVAARVEPELKQDAEKILRIHNITPTEVIRRVYSYIVVEGEVPEILKTGEYEIRAFAEPNKFERLQDWIQDGPLSQYDWSGMSDSTLAEAMDERAGKYLKGSGEGDE